MRNWRYLLMVSLYAGGWYGADMARAADGAANAATVPSGSPAGQGQGGMVAGQAVTRVADPLPGQASAAASVQGDRQQAGRSWFSDIGIGLQLEGGGMANGAPVHDGRNFGALLQSRNDSVTLNQLALTLTKPVDPLGGGYGLGANIQLIYGSDAGIYTITGVSDRWFSGSRYQLTPLQANIALHMPWLTRGGLDMQLGILPSPMGVEGANPASRAFYSLSYTAQYSNPFEHVGFYGQWHLTSRYAVLFGVDAGNQKSFGRGNSNGQPAGYVGFNASQLAHGALSLTYLLRVGPEDPRRLLGAARAREAQRFWNDLNATWQVSRKWTLTAEATQVHDEGLSADAWSGVLWGGYAVAPTLALNARAEVYRDSKGVFVAEYPDDASYGRSLLGLPARSYTAPPTTYGAVSLNAVWKPAIGHHLKLLQVRPEIRFDRALNNTRPFADFRHQNRILLGGDVTVGF